METIKFLVSGALALVGALLLVAALPADGAELHKAATYIDYTGKPVTVAWDPVSGATKYTWRVRSLERGQLVEINGATEHDTFLTTFTFSLPYQGHFIVEVKAMDDAGNSSTWAISTSDNHATVEDRPQGWWVYGHLAPAGDIEF